MGLFRRRKKSSLEDLQLKDILEGKMKVFSHDEFFELAHSGDAIFKIPEQLGGGYFLMELVDTELTTGIGIDINKYQQNWEIEDDRIINNTPHFIFRMWGNLPDNIKVYKDISNHEGKEIAVPVKTIFDIIEKLALHDPVRYDVENLRKTQTIKKYIDQPENKIAQEPKIEIELNTDREKSIELCNLGISEKRKGEHDAALDFYKKAKQADYTNPASYMNSAKILIGIDSSEDALRDILTFTHLKHPNDINQFESVRSFYVFDDSHIIPYNNHNISKIIGDNNLVKQIAVDVNTTFYAGLSYSLTNPETTKTIIDDNGIDISLIDNEISLVLGTIPNGNNVRQSKFANTFHILGLLFLYKNLNMSLEDEYSISQYYLNPNTELVPI